MVLHEAISSVDTRTERHIEEGMDALMEKRTAFVIAHRLSAVRKSNTIMVLKKGGIIERGTHEELLAAGNGNKVKEIMKCKSVIQHTRVRNSITKKWT